MITHVLKWTPGNNTSWTSIHLHPLFLSITSPSAVVVEVAPAVVVEVAHPVLVVPLVVHLAGVA